MKVGDLVRYKHDKYQLGVILEIREGRQDKYFVLWRRAVDGRLSWCVQGDWIQVKDADGRYGWRDWDKRDV